MFLIKPFVTTFLALCICFGSEAGDLKKIRKAFEAGKFDKTERKICKSLEKDSVNPGAKYYLSALLVHEQYDTYDIDSSWYWINQAIEDLTRADEAMEKALRKSELKREDFFQQRDLVASLAFDKAEQQMTIFSFDHYLSIYVDTEDFERATYTRDSLAFDVALNSNTWQSYENYFQTYPNAAFVPEARQRYQSLIFKDYTKDDQLESYVTFLEEHPNTPFRRLAEEIILTRSILDHKWESYKRFLQKYPETHLRKKIGDILYYKSRNNNDERLEEVLNLHSHPDSLRMLYELEEKSLFPVFEGGVFGFLTLDFASILKPQYAFISEKQICGNITSEWLHVENKIINRGNEIVLEDISEFNELGFGVALAKKHDSRLYHKSGFRISDIRVNDARVLTNGLIAFQPEYDWGIMTMLGYPLISPEYESIEVVGEFLVLEKEDSFRVASESNIKNTRIKPFEVVFDDYEVIGDTLFQGFVGDQECLLDRNLHFLIPLDTHSIYISSHSWYVRDSSGYQIYDKKDTELMNQKFAYLDANEGWITLKNQDGWLLISRQVGKALVIKELDSVRLISNNAAFIKKGDTLEVLFQSGKREILQNNETIQVLNNSNVHYLLFSHRGNHRVFDASGQLLFVNKDEEVSLLGDSTFRYKRNSKVGVLDHNGSVLIPTKYDLANENDGLVFLLKGDGIGCYDLAKNVLIPTEYQTRIFSFGEQHYEVQKKGKTGLVNSRNQATVPYEYDQLLQWNDTSLWARKADEWQLITFDHKVLLKGVRSVELWFENAVGSHAWFLTETGLGLLSNTQGEILPPQYNDILNVGSKDQPIFFAEQHLKAASFYVVTYFDQLGNNLKSQAFRPEEYEKIYCDL